MSKKRTAVLFVSLLAAMLLSAAAFVRVGQAAALSAAEGNRPLVIAHRAGAALGPENTLAALELSIAAGADMAEVDVQLTRDGVPVLLHDGSLARTTGLDRAVKELDLAQVAELDAGSSFSADFAGEPVPTLEQLLAAAKGRIRLMLELKQGDREEELAQRTAELVKRYGMEGECVMASSGLSLLERCRTLLPQTETVYIVNVLYPGVREERADSYSVSFQWFAGAEVLQAHNEGKPLYVWTVNSGQEMEKLLGLGVDGLVTDNPALAAELLAQGE